MQNRLISLRPKAEEDLESIYRYSLENFGSSRANQYLNDIDEVFRRLSEMPTLAKDYDHIRTGLKAFPIVSHIIFFKTSATHITISRILHKSMDFQKHL